MNKSPHDLGISGESIAEQYLRRKGYSILEKGFRYLKGEIDIIARDGSCLVFVEVKTRSEEDYGSAEEAVTFSKQRQIKKTARGYLFQNQGSAPECRFDVVAVIASGEGGFLVRHFPQAFE